MRLTANSGKKLTSQVDTVAYYRYSIKTHRISEKDTILQIVKKYTQKHLRKGDMVVISERVVAITQGRSIPIKDINPSWWAQKLYTYVYKHPGGIGLRSPYTMEIAIREAGLLRILLAAFLAVMTKPFGLRGVFYHVAGHGVNAIDGPTPYTLPPGNTSVTLGPENPEKVSQEIEDALGFGVVIIDANDYGVRVLAKSHRIDLSDNMLRRIFSDNPMGQSDEQTPIIIVRKKS
ncbi:hypothetical protein A3H80_04085 [Candidatus Roizmanbacteria bacterium RIFCSPLOWO2_02_FULL_37_19]|uniref:Coenzyme F420:L-glutamate ligase-like domain-containing protein n=1 Tax=Candidatus Roizmanbacteria bacterium RIFCSPHIGHO2_02_FULL_37_24 TaxID=1802037 RepID=A0A1F7GWA8_9BACT|nr:MAG: hypothetical protein A2862_01715 [Candidatus Roizmanbacteria bacterium RIFCSPHIGHO2_01_FULL_38_41]OGK23095.1 MAG: hypothetical protein A3C24_04790 [Candidatus Roizmanbacteria bacterium RIFCSPHIGHO2_02_FULL_37_24]OGK32581.1 MAG: hypothetical protein A3E10_02605 [Candidatus Roizmanbacteria bacterium RIFCSPHIGHO2_12_FULL_37_23]OGK43379.1 MAG: hypothetical protein A2956_00495 [Candidatus Roizmanbacteria bacterium RIFCSPLOWO2_01_FULL_37_57]OGK53712.1 MAG: hypothetical protein A3H80_04085 [Ca